MKTTVETIDPVTVKLTVEVEAKKVKKAFDRAAREIGKGVTLPGFRPGKAPRRLLEKRVGEGAIAQQALESSLGDYYAQALRKEELDAVAQPEIDVKNFTEDEGCTFEATVEVRPEIELPDHTGIGVSYPEWEVSDEEVESRIEDLRERFAEVDEVERAAETGDYVTIDLAVIIDGEELESAHVEDALYEIGSSGVTPKLDDELVGKEAGDEFTYTDNLPEEYPDHGGAEAEFAVTVKDVREKTLPEPDDDFAATASEFDSMDELRKDTRDTLLRRSVVTAQNELRGRIVEAFLANVDPPLPPTMVEEEAHNRIHRIEHQAQQYGLDVEQLFEMEGTTREQFEETAKEQAVESVKATLVLDALARELDIDVTGEDLDREITRHAQSQNAQPEQIAELIQQQGTLGVLVGDVLRRKAIDAVFAAANIDGGPSDEVLIELGLMDDPNAPDETDEDETAEDATATGEQADVDESDDSDEE